MAARKCRARLSIAGLVAVAWFIAATRPMQSEIKTDALGGRAPGAAGPRVIGTGRCSARACHGSMEPVQDTALWRSAYTIWVTKDKHARAYEILFSERSERMARNLAGGGLGDKTEPTGSRYVPAHQDARCLACHSFPSSAGATGPVDRAIASDGVGCEACHGPAERWLKPHTAPDRWKRNPPDVKEAEYGMVPLEDLVRRAEACARCHVGAAPDQEHPLGRDAFHDIMAAGHPRLNFEFAAFLATMPRHWKEKDQAADFEVRAWVTGQLVTARAALELLEFRARAAAAETNRVGAEKRPWPEFAETECYACHHDLAEPSWRQRRGYAGQPPGSLPWGTWFLPMTRLLARQQPNENQELLSELDDLERRMSGRDPDPREVAEVAHHAAKLLAESLLRARERPYDAPAVEGLLAACAQQAPALVDSNWDAAAQLYLALIALNQVLKDAQIDAALPPIFEALTFPAGYDSPRDSEKYRDNTASEHLASELEQIRRRSAK